MLTDLSFLEEGQSFPPKGETERLERYRQNKLLFESEHLNVYEEQFKRIERVIGNFQNVVSYSVITNYQKLLTLKNCDLLLGETPIINDGIDSDITEIIMYSRLFNVMYEVSLDISRYGTGIFYIYQDEDGKGVIDVAQPSCWFPVVDAENIKKTRYHVLAWASESQEGKKRKLIVQIHEKGRVSRKEFLLESGKIGRLLFEESFETGFDDFCVIPVHNNSTSDRIYGIDDYRDIDSIVSEIEVRLSQIAKVLDKHTNPTMTGPFGALDYDDDSGQYYLKAGNYIPLEENDGGSVKYITWDAHLDANFKYIDALINILYSISETGGALLGDISRGGAVMSGTALRLRMISPISKVNRIRVRLDLAVKEALAMASQIGWKRYKMKDISIKWRDGLPDDDLELAKIANLRTGGKATLSRKRAIITLDGVTPLEAENVVDEIDSDEYEK